MNCPDDGSDMVFHPYGDTMNYKSNVLGLPAPCDLWMCPKCETFYPATSEDEVSE